MQKFLVNTIVTTLLGSLSGNTLAQLPPTSTPTPATSDPISSTAPDLKLLNQAVGLFWQGNRARTESQIVLTIQGKTAAFNSVTINATVKSIAQTGDLFRSELTISRSGNPTKNIYTIVSNGRDVWLYRPDKGRYSQLKLSEFKSQFYSPLIGLTSIFFVSMSEKDRQKLITDLASNPNYFKLLTAEEIKNIQGITRQVDGKNLYVYYYSNPKVNTNFVGFVRPDTGKLQQVEFVSDSEFAVVKIVEKIIDRTTTTTVESPDRLFKFSPPQGTKKVDSISTELLQLLQ